MQFIGREEEIAWLREERKRSRENARFTVVTGRRRVGKTELIRHAYNDGAGRYLYLLLNRQSERMLCAAVAKSIREQIGGALPIVGTVDHLIDLLRAVFALGVSEPITVVIDEFQEMDYVNSTFFAELQGLWDEIHTTHKINLVVSGSVNRMMNKIFFDYASPLYGRSTGHLNLRPFSPSLMKRIYTEHAPKFSAAALLDLWAITGGIAKYVALLMDAKAYTREKMLAEVVSMGSTFLEEGRAILMQEFGNEFGTYFSILSAIACGHTRFAEIVKDLGIELGSYLSNLENNYKLIRKVLPIYSSAKAKNAMYQIDDMFFRFWFRYIFKNQSQLALGHYELLRKEIAADFDVFNGFALECYFYWKLATECDYRNLGAWWDRKNENEIDLVAEAKGRLDFFEVKRDVGKIDLKVLERKAVAFFEKNPDRQSLKTSFRGLSLADM